MNKKTYYFFNLMIVLALVLSTSSCKKADIKFGEELITDNELNIFRVDSFSANLSTVYQDSFVTSARGNIMLGSYTDPLFGYVSTQSYFEVAPPVWADIYQQTIFDSLQLILKPNGIFYGDTTKPVTITVRELQDSIIYPENKFYLYNTSSFAAKPAVLGTFTGMVAPRSGQAISISLPQSLGQDLLSKLIDPNDNPIKSTVKFLNFFRGFQISSDNGNSLIFNCTDNAVMRLYYRQNSFPATVNKTVDFSLTNTGHQFNNISIARSGALQNLNANNREILSAATANAAYTQSVTGSLVKITFPTLKDVAKLPKFAKVLKATLYIKPLKNSFNSIYTLPPTLRLSQTNINNQLGSDLAYLTANGGIAVQLGSLQIDNFNNEKTQYQYDLTQYVKSILAEGTPTPGEGLLLSPPSPNFQDQFARVVVGDNANALGNIQLQIYYATVK